MLILVYNRGKWGNMEGDVNYLSNNNPDCEIELGSGEYQRANLVVIPPGGLQTSETEPLLTREVENQNPGVEHFMYQELNDVVIQGTPLRFDEVLSLDPGHGFLNPVGINNDYLNIHYADPLDKTFIGTRFSQHVVTNVTLDDITITPPLSYNLNPSNVEFSKRANVNMAVLGSRAAKIKFMVYPPNGQSWELRRFIPDMILSTAGDDGLFGNITRLLNGEFFGFENPFFAEYNLAVFDNGGYASSGYDTKYPIRSGGGGSFGFNVRKTVAGKDKQGIVITLDGLTSDRFVKYTQDDLTGLARYRIKVFGDIKVQAA